MTKPTEAKRIHTIVIGGGQAGLAVGYYLAKRGIPFRILDASERIGDAWRNRWDSLKLFTPAKYVDLPGMPYPGHEAFPTKDAVADYVEAYAKHFDLPVQSGAKVERLWKQGDRFRAQTAGEQYEAENVVVAMANYQEPKLPPFAGDLDPAIVQLHSHHYRNPAQLQEGGVLVVGVGNSGADIGIEVARTHPTWIAGKETGSIPFPIDTFFARNVMFRIVRFVGHHILSVATPIGRNARAKLLSRASPLVRVKPKDLDKAGIVRVPRVAGVREGKPLLEDGRILDVQNVVWCTGYHPGFSWIDLPVFDKDGKPMHDRGIVERVPGLYFVGLHFLYSMSSATLIGVGRDAERVVKAIGSQRKALAKAA